PDGFPRAHKVEGLQVPETAVDRPQVVERVPRPEIATFDERDGESPLCGIGRDGEAVDAAADDEQVEGVGAETRYVPNHGHIQAASTSASRYTVVVSRES